MTPETDLTSPTPSAEPSAAGTSPADMALQPLEMQVVEVGRELAETVGGVLDRIPGQPHGPQALATALSVDKVLTSRLLKALRSREPVAVVHHLPGPEPLRRVLRAADALGIDPERIRAAAHAVDRFESMIRREVGDRSGLDAVLSAWLPEARREFELRRKQSAFKAMSQLKGVEARVSLGTVLLHPSEDGVHMDVVWLMGHLGMHRLRPGVTVRFATKRMEPDGAVRHPQSLSGSDIESIEDAMLREFCDRSVAAVNIERAGDRVHYTLGGEAFGPSSTCDFLIAEVNPAELPRCVPAGSGRRGYVFASVSIPVRLLVFDVIVHESLYTGREPALAIYDTAVEGLASVNDRSRDISRLDQMESIQMLGAGTASLGHAEVPRYPDMVRHVMQRMHWDALQFRAYRVAIDYPVYGSQVTVSFEAPEARAE